MLVTICSVFVIWVHHHSESVGRPQRWIRTLVFKFLGTLVFMRGMLNAEKRCAEKKRDSIRVQQREVLSTEAGLALKERIV